MRGVLNMLQTCSIENSTPEWRLSFKHAIQYLQAMKYYSTVPYVQHAPLCVWSHCSALTTTGALFWRGHRQTRSGKTAISLTRHPPKWKERYGMLKLPQDACSCLCAPAVSVTHNTGLPGQQLCASSRVCPKSRLELRVLNYNTGGGAAVITNMMWNENVIPVSCLWIITRVTFLRFKRQLFCYQTKQSNLTEWNF